MDLALNNLQRLICHKTKQTKQTKQIRHVLNITVIISETVYISLFIDWTRKTVATEKKKAQLNLFPWRLPVNQEDLHCLGESYR